MNTLKPSELKTILHSKRANLFYLQFCRVLVNGGRVEYITDEGNQSLYWNIPIANTTCLLLGTGTSITQAAMRELAKAGVLVGFCGGGGTPLFATNEVEVEVSWLCSQSEYRPTQYLQHWVSFWFNDKQRVSAAIAFQQARIHQIRHIWLGPSLQREPLFNLEPNSLAQALHRFEQALVHCQTSNDVLAQEAALTKTLYKICVHSVNYGDFTRAKRGTGIDVANRLLDHGNYLAYGLAATACWVIGLPHGLAVLHGKTRRGGLVFDVADLIKDAMVLPYAFISSMAGEEEAEFRQRIINGFNKHNALDFMIDTIQSVAQKHSCVSDI